MSQAARLLALVSACERAVLACRQGATAKDWIDWTATQRQFEEILTSARDELAELTPVEVPWRESSSHFRAVGQILEESKR